MSTTVFLENPSEINKISYKCIIAINCIIAYAIKLGHSQKSKLVVIRKPIIGTVI